jgi:hypothetical protein
MRRSLYLLSVCFFLITINCPVFSAEDNSVTPQITVTVTNQPPDKHYEIAVMGGLNFISASIIPGVTTNEPGSESGADGEIEGYYLFDHHWGLGLSIGYHHAYYSSVDILPEWEGNFNFGFLDFLAVSKYRFRTKGLRPYLISGVGICSYNWSSVVNGAPWGSMPFTLLPPSPYSSSTIYPELSGGIGFEIPLFFELNLFIQGKYNWIPTLATNSHVSFFVPIDAGVNLLF